MNSRPVRRASLPFVVLYLVPYLFLAAGTALAADPPPAGAEKFRRWATQAAKQKGMRLCRGGTAQFSPQQKPAQFAIFQQGDDNRYALVVSWPGHLRAFRTDDVMPHGFDCPQPFTWEKTRVIKLGPWGQGTRRFAQVAVVDDQLALLEEQEEESDWGDLVNWETLSASGYNFEDKSKHDASLLLVLDPKSPGRAQLPRPKTWVTFQKTPHGGSADSALMARVDLAGDTLQVEMEATDDVLRPPANPKLTDAAFLKTDHFELWFCAPATQTAFCEKKDTRQLGVARTAGGQLHARWLHPKGNKEKLPAVEAGGPKGAAIVVKLPLAQIRHKGDPMQDLSGELTVAYSDADVDGKGQEAVVATSDVKWGQGSSFGKFVRHVGGARFPAWDGGAQFGEDEAWLTGLPKP